MNRSIPIFLLLVFLGSCNTVKDGRVVIVATTDVHGTIFSKDPADGSLTGNSMSAVSSLLGRYDRDKLVLLDNGDNIQGTPTVYYYNFESAEEQHIWTRVTNYLGYDAITVGNHDIEAGHAVYDRLSEESGIPMLAANAIEIATGEPYFEPYTIIKRNGLRVGVLGLITPGVPGWLPEVLYEGIEFEDMVESASEWMPQLQAENPDIIVGLFHAGWNDTYGGAEPGSYMNENASLNVAKEVQGFDLVIIGHDHDLMADFVINNHSGDTVWVLDGGSHARFVSVAEVDVSGGKAVIKAYNVRTDSIGPDPDFDSYFEESYITVRDYIGRPIGVIDRTISSRDAYFGDSRFMDLIHRVQLETTGADLSFAAPLSFDVRIDSGELRVSDMFDLYRYENMLYTMELTGSEIDGYLEYSYSLWLSKVTGEKDPLLIFEDVERGRLKNRYYNFDSAAGIEYTVDITGEPGNRVTISGFSDGRPFIADSAYSVAVNSYRGSGGGGHLERGAGLLAHEIASRLLNSTDKDLRYYMMKWIEKSGTVEATVDNNWKMIPERLAARAATADYRRMFKD